MNKKYREDTRRFNFYSNNRKKCKCGHSVLFERGKTICSFCGNYVFKNKQEEFVYRVEEAINRIKRGVK